MQHAASINALSIVEWVIDEFPQTVPVFLRWRMHCVGCPIARFESIGDVCRHYQRPEVDFLGELQQAASRNDRSASEESDAPTYANRRSNPMI